MAAAPSQQMMELIARTTYRDESTLEELATVVVGVCPDEEQQFTPFRVVIQVENQDRWNLRHDLAKRREIMSSLLHNVAMDIEKRFFDLGRAQDLEIAIALHRKALEITPKTHSVYPVRFTSLAKSIEARYDQSGVPADLDLAVNMHHTLIATLWESPQALGAGMVPYLSNLADALGKRYNVSRDLEDFDHSILLRRQIVQLTQSPSEDYINASKLLSQTLVLRFRLQGQAADLDEAIELRRIVLALRTPNQSVDDVNSLEDLRALAEAIYVRFRDSDRIDDLEELIDLNEKILKSGQGSKSDRDATMSLLSLLFHERFGRLGSQEDLDQAIATRLELINVQGKSHPGRCGSLINLSSLLRSKFEAEGRRKSLDDAIACLYEALELVPPPHEDRSRVLNNLSMVLRQRFEETDRYDDLLDAIDLSKEALKLQAPSTESRISTLTNLAAALWSRYDPSTGTEADLDAIISLHREALGLSSKEGPTRSAIVGNLANALRLHFEKSRNRDDLIEAISLIQELLQAARPASQESSVFINLGLTFCQFYQLTNESAHLDSAMSAFKSVAAQPNRPITQRSIAARAWAERAEHFKHPSAMEAYRLAIDLLPLVVPLNADLELRHHKLTSNITRIDGLAAAAASCALQAGKFDDAVEFLEAGRAVFWSQALKLRLPIEELEEANPELAKKIQDTRKQLELASFATKPESSTLTDGGMTDDHLASMKSRQLDLKWNSALKEINSMPGFEDFLRPRSFSALQKCAINGPIIMLCVMKASSHALVLTASQVKHVPLPDIALPEVMALVKNMEYVQNPGSREGPSGSVIDGLLEEMSKFEISDIDRALRKVKRLPSREEALRNVLKTLWLKIAEPVIRFLDLKRSSNHLRVYWCPTGPLTFLPIHAAGIYTDSSFPAESVMDYAVSSYLPTIGTLLNSQNQARQDTKSNKVMVIAEPKTLPAALDEIQKISKLFELEPSETLVKLGDKASNPATVREVLNHLSSSSVVHFACHGKQHAGNPLESALTLEDGQLTLSMIMQEDVKGARLAFLSACETASGEKAAPDESFHIGAALLFVGFRAVIATMWAIADIDGPKVADEFYKKLLEKREGHQEGRSGLDTSQSAQALHHAIVELQKSGVPLQRWVPFIHLGL